MSGHLADCSDCLTYVAQVQQTARVLGQLRNPGRLTGLLDYRRRRPRGH